MLFGCRDLLARAFLSSLPSGAKGIDGILFGRNRPTVSGGRLKVPVLQRRKTFAIDVRAQTLQHRLVYDFSAFVDHNLDHLVARRRWQLPRPDHGIRSRSGKGRANLIASERTVIETPVGNSSLGAVTQC